LFEKFGLIHQVITFVKDGGNNLASMGTTFCSITHCEPLNILQVYVGTFFGHVLFKTCYYATNDGKKIMGLKQVSVKDA
jgi:hypothetical protein